MACGSCGGGAKSAKIIRSQQVASMKALRIGETKPLKPTNIRSGVDMSKAAQRVNRHRA